MLNSRFFSRSFLSQFHLPLWAVTLCLLLSPTLLLAESAAEKPAGSAASDDVSGASIRAVWVQSRGPALGSPAGCRALVQELIQIHATDVFLEVRNLADAYYVSQLAPLSRSLPDEFTDPLGYFLEELQAQKSPDKPRVHVVLDVLRLDDLNYPLPPSDSHITRKHPEWIMHTEEGNVQDAQGFLYLEPSLPGVQAHLAEVVRELVSNYAIDGVHFSGLHYVENGKNWGFSPPSIKRFQIETSATTDRPNPDDIIWQNWRRAQLSDLLEVLTDAAHRAKPELIVSVSAIASGPLPESETGYQPADFQIALQDWPRWLESERVDWLVLRDFQNNRKSQERFVRWIDFAHSCAGQAPLIVAVSGPLNTDSGIVMQLRLALSRQVQGIMVHSYQQPAGNLSSENDFLKYLGRTIFSPDYVLPSYVQDAVTAALPEPHKYLPEALMSQQLPAPLSLSNTTDVKKVPRIFSQEDAGKALLGETILTDAERDQLHVWTGQLSYQQQRALSRERNLYEPQWVMVRLIGGGHFIGERLYGDDKITKFRSKKNHVIFTINNAIIGAMKPYEESDEIVQP